MLVSGKANVPSLLVFVLITLFAPQVAVTVIPAWVIGFRFSSTIKPLAEGGAEHWLSSKRIRTAGINSRYVLKFSFINK